MDKVKISYENHETGVSIVATNIFTDVSMEVPESDDGYIRASSLGGTAAAVDVRMHVGGYMLRQTLRTTWDADEVALKFMAHLPQMEDVIAEILGRVFSKRSDLFSLDENEYGYQVYGIPVGAIVVDLGPGSFGYPQCKLVRVVNGEVARKGGLAGTPVEGEHVVFWPPNQRELDPNVEVPDGQDQEVFHADYQAFEYGVWFPGVVNSIDSTEETNGDRRYWRVVYKGETTVSGSYGASFYTIHKGHRLSEFREIRRGSGLTTFESVHSFASKEEIPDLKGQHVTLEYRKFKGNPWICIVLPSELDAADREMLEKLANNEPIKKWAVKIGKSVDDGKQLYAVAEDENFAPCEPSHAHHWSLYSEYHDFPAHPDQYVILGHKGFRSKTIGQNPQQLRMAYYKGTGRNG